MTQTYLILALLLIIGCKQDTVSSNNAPAKMESIAAPSKATVGYNYDVPDGTFILDNKLKEISGLAYDKEKNSLIANNDEKGSFYDLDITNGKIVNKIKFGSKGDYEGIEKIDDEVIIAKHNGSLFIYDIQSKETEEFKTVLSSKNDVEGLCYYSPNNSLLLACKGQSLEEDKTKKGKSIYAFNLNTKKLDEDPFLKIEDTVLVKWMEENQKSESKSKLDKKIKKLKDFAPSGICYNNAFGDLYIISAKGSTLLIFDKNKNLKHIQMLNNKTIPQPEGICFDKDNNLYISTEGQGFSGKIFKYNYNGK